MPFSTYTIISRKQKFILDQVRSQMPIILLGASRNLTDRQTHIYRVRHIHVLSGLYWHGKVNDAWIFQQVNFCLLLLSCEVKNLIVTCSLPKKILLEILKVYTSSVMKHTLLGLAISRIVELWLFCWLLAGAAYVQTNRVK